MSDAQDAARYRFICYHMAVETIHYVEGGTDYSTWKVDTFRHSLTGGTFDEAVDKAIDPLGLTRTKTTD